jgi:hypothetical protein
MSKEWIQADVGSIIAFAPAGRDVYSLGDLFLAR